jgi:3-phosphoshikimate 1-carboxyvinyltransferase
MEVVISGRSKGYQGAIELPGDKSISHRALLFGAMADGETELHNVGLSEDVLNTLEFCKAVGAQTEIDRSYVRVMGTGMRLSEPHAIVSAGNSGTLARLAMGVATGIPGITVFSGDESLSRRPMLRVVEPLRRMGAAIFGRHGGNFLPIAVTGTYVQGTNLQLPVASAQVKSAILLAGLKADGTTEVVEPALSRPHTEEFFGFTGIEFQEDYDGDAHLVRIDGGQVPRGFAMWVPGDPSSAAFFIVGALVCQNSKVVVSELYLGKTRSHFLEVLTRMGAKVKKSGDTIEVVSSDLEGTHVSEEEVPWIIDEIPILAVAAAFAKGRSRFSGIAELRVKESDRLAAIESMLGKFGVRVEAGVDWLEIHGGSFRPVDHKLKIASEGDHRIAMSAAIMATLLESEVRISGCQYIGTSFPNFFALLEQVTGVKVEGLRPQSPIGG